MALRSRLLMQTCLLAILTGTGLAPATALAQTPAPVPLFLKQEAERDADKGPEDGQGISDRVGSPGLAAPEASAAPDQGESFPADPNAVQSLTLQAVDAEAVGTIDRSRGGLGIDMWNGTTRKSAAKLISELPAIPATHAARDLQERLLLSIAALPQDTPEVHLLEARVAKLINMGALDGAIDLVRATSRTTRGSMLAQAEVNALLIGSRIEEACAAIEGYGATFDELFWLKAAAMCALYANDPTRAAFSVDLVREVDGENDQTFFGLVAAIRSGTPAKPELLEDLRPIDIALLTIAKQSIPTGQLETGNAAAIIGLATAPVTATDIRLEAARKAEKLGLIDTEQLARIYQDVNFDPGALDRALDDAREGVQARQYAKLYQAAAQSDVPAARAEILAALFEAGEIEGDFMQVARLSAPLMTDIPVNSDFSWFAVSALKASIAANAMERAENWLQVAKNSANSGNDIASRLSLLYPVLAISGLEETGTLNPARGNAPQVASVESIDEMPGSDSPAPLRFGLGGAISSSPTTAAADTDAMAATRARRTVDRAALARHRARLTEWQEMQAARGDQAAARRHAELVYNLFDGFGIDVPASLWDNLMTAPYAEERMTVSSAVAYHLKAASSARQKAKTVAMAIQAQQIAGVANADPKVLADTVAALEMVGLEGDARRLATELLLSAEK